MFTQTVVIVGRITTDSVAMLGTAFAVSGNGQFATTRHVVGSQDRDLVILAPHIRSLNTYQDLSDTSCQPVPAKIIEVDPVRDIAIIQAGVTYNGPLYPLGSFDNAEIGDEIYSFGFPHCPQGSRCLTFQKTYVGAKVLLKNNGVESKHAVINTQARPGQSGSPVFSPKQNQISGILVGAWGPSGGGISLGGINPHELHQTTHCISANHIKDML